jgi:predicted transcriptional regulator
MIVKDIMKKSVARCAPDGDVASVVEVMRNHDCGFLPVVDSHGKSVVTPVKVGPSDITHTLVESGLKEGDQVIVGPYKVLEGLANDTKVRDERTVTTQPSKR